jgi:hypothetical protein
MIYSIDSIKEALIPLFKDNKIKRAILFGSHAKGVADEKSDVDLIIDSGGLLCGLNFFGFREDVYQALKGVDVDLIEISEIKAHSQMEKEIQGTGVVIYDES